MKRLLQSIYKTESSLASHLVSLGLDEGVGGGGNSLSNVLHVPIVVITSLASFPYTTFLPDSVMVTTPLYLTYDATACGHYDATRKLVGEYGSLVGYLSFLTFNDNDKIYL